MNLDREREAAVRLRRTVTQNADLLIDQYMGDRYQEGVGPEIAPHENHAAEFIPNTISALSYYDPKVRVKTRRPQRFAGIAEAVKLGLDQWIKDVRFGEEMQRAALHTLFSFCPVLVGMEPVEPGSSVLRPAVRIISPGMYFRDPQCGWSNRPRFEGHYLIEDADTLLAETDSNGRPVYDADAVKAAAGKDDDWEKESVARTLEDLGIDRVERNQVVFSEIYVHETQTIYTLGLNPSDGSSGYLRPPRKAFCPPWGPYTMCGILSVPDQVYPLSLLAVSAGLVDELNSQLEMIHRMADQMKTMTFVNGANKGLVRAAKNGRHGDVHAISGYDPSQMGQMTIGAPDPKQFDYTAMLRQRLDRLSGLTQNRAGAVTGGTAREVDEVAAGDQARRRFIVQQWERSMRRVIETVAWMMVFSPAVAFDIQPEGTQGDGDMIYIGGIQQGQEDFTWSDLALDIEPYSMEYVDENEVRQTSLLMLQTFEATAPMMAQFPFVKWKPILDEFCEAFGKDDSAKYFDYQALGMMSAMGMMGQMQAVGVTPSPQQQPQGGAVGKGGGNQPRNRMSKPTPPGAGGGPPSAGSATPPPQAFQRQEARQ